MQINLASQFFHHQFLLLLHFFQGFLKFLCLVNQVQVLFFKFREDHVEVIGVREAQVFIVEVIVYLYQFLCEEHLEFGLPILVIHVFSFKLLELQCIPLLVLIQSSCTPCWKCTSK